jgi:hypothetical protein
MLEGQYESKRALLIMTVMVLSTKIKINTNKIKTTLIVGFI